MKTARLYQCALCSAQVIICSNCDRGNIYCGTYCAKQARLENHRKSNRLYQKSLIGKINNARRQSRFRERQNKKVTDQGSLAKLGYDLLSDMPKKQIKLQKTNVACCAFCRTEIMSKLRQGFLHRRDYSICYSGP